MAIEDIAERLEAMNLPELREKALAEIRSGKKTRRQQGVKMLRAIEGMQRSGVAPGELIMRRVPVIPPAFRPYTMAGDTFVPGDANELYSDLVKSVQLHREAEKTFGKGNALDSSRYVRSAVRAAYGYQDSPNPKIKSRGVSGLMTKILGSGPKTSFVQSKLLAKPQDFVGRGVISPDPDLTMDELGLPEEMAWELFDAHLRRSMASRGIPMAKAMVAIKERQPQARQILEQVMKTQPVIYSRAPAWHRQNVISGYAKMTEGSNIKISPLVTAGVAGDFDGDFQHNYVVFSLTRSSLKHLQLFFIDLTPILEEAPNMFNKLSIPYLDTATHCVGIIDLEDFPRGELLGSKKTEVSEIDFYRALDGVQVIAYDESTNAPRWASVAGWSEHRGCPVEIVSLENRRQIFSDDDPRAVYGIDPAGDLTLQRFTPTEALARKVAVPIVRRCEALLLELGALTEIQVTTQSECAFKTLPLDFDLGWFLGALCGDGWWDKQDSSYCELRSDMSGKRSVQLADLAGNNAARLNRYITRALDPEQTLYYHRFEQKKQEGDSRYGDTVKHSFNFKHSELLAEFLSLQLGGAGDIQTSGAANKRIPAFAFQAPAEFRIGLLNGLVDTDGSCSVSHAKGAPQLLCSFGTTSLRLAREVQLLCRSLNVQATVVFSKDTSGGNKAWIVTMSAPDCKRLNLFARLASPYKRQNFVETAVAEENTSAAYDKVIFTKAIAELLLANLPAPRVTDEETRRLHNMWFRVNRARGRGVISRVAADQAFELIMELEARRKELREQALTWCAASATGGEFCQEDSDKLREAVRAIAPFGHPLYTAGCKIAARLNKPLRGGKISGKVVAGLLAWFSSQQATSSILDPPEIVRWREQFVASEVSWSPVTKVEKTGQVETGYDLTVPGYETFMSADGIILSNTMSAHVPALPEAVEDAREKLLPSKMLFSVRNRDQTIPVPKHEMLLGLAASQLAPSGVVHQFANKEQALVAIKAGQVNLQDQVEVPDV